MNPREEKIRKKITDDEDYIHCPRLGNSLKTFVSKYPEGIDDEKIAKVLMIEKTDAKGEKQPDTEEVERIFQTAIRKLRRNMKISLE